MLKNHLLLHFLILIWGFTAILGKLITLPGVELVFYRTLIAFTVLGAALAMRRSTIWPSRKDALKIIAVGLMVGLHWVLFFVAAEVSTISVCLAGMATTSLWTSLLEPFFGKKRIKWYEVLLGLIVIGGLVTIFSAESEGRLGLLLASLSALLCSLFTIASVQQVRKHEPFVISFFQLFGAWWVVVLMLPIYKITFAEGHILQMIPTTLDWLWLLILSLVCTVYAYSVSIKIMRKLSAFTVNLSVNMEPIYGITLAAIIFNEHEQVTGGFYVGTAVILLSVVAHPIFEFYEKKRKNRAALKLQTAEQA